MLLFTNVTSQFTMDVGMVALPAALRNKKSTHNSRYIVQSEDGNILEKTSELA